MSVLLPFHYYFDESNYGYMSYPGTDISGEDMKNIEKKSDRYINISTGQERSNYYGLKRKTIIDDKGSKISFSLNFDNALFLSSVWLSGAYPSLKFLMISSLKPLSLRYFRASLPSGECNFSS